jgi:hypothetical protein
MNIDFKIKVWERIEVPQELEEQALKLVQSGKITTGIELINWIDEQGGNTNWEILPETEEYLTPKENENMSTIEVWGENKEGNSILYDNGKCD